MNNQQESPAIVPSGNQSGGRIHQASDIRPSIISLIVANIVPLIGVLFFGWSLFAVVAIYWAENVVIGAINVLKILFANPDVRQLAVGFVPKTGEEREHLEDLTQNWQQHSRTLHALKLFLIPFFIFHYGLFCFVHGMFILVLLGNDDPFSAQAPNDAQMIERFTQEHLWWGVAALAISHLVSFFTNYLGRGEYRRMIPIVLMFQPYLRVVLLHVAILLGAFATLALGSPVFIVLLLIVGKTILDLKLHVREHSKPGSAPMGIESIFRGT